MARNISLMILGSSSTGGLLAAIDVLAATGGTLMLLKSKLAKPVGKAEIYTIFFNDLKNYFIKSTKITKYKIVFEDLSYK